MNNRTIYNFSRNLCTIVPPVNNLLFLNGIDTMISFLMCGGLTIFKIRYICSFFSFQQSQPDNQCVHNILLHWLGIFVFEWMVEIRLMCGQRLCVYTDHFPFPGLYTIWQNMVWLIFVVNIGNTKTTRKVSHRYRWKPAELTRI